MTYLKETKKLITLQNLQMVTEILKRLNKISDGQNTPAEKTRLNTIEYLIVSSQCNYITLDGGIIYQIHQNINCT